MISSTIAFSCAPNAPSVCVRSTNSFNSSTRNSSGVSLRAVIAAVNLSRQTRSGPINICQQRSGKAVILKMCKGALILIDLGIISPNKMSMISPAPFRVACHPNPYDCPIRCAQAAVKQKKSTFTTRLPKSKVTNRPKGLCSSRPISLADVRCCVFNSSNLSRGSEKRAVSEPEKKAEERSNTSPMVKPIQRSILIISNSIPLRPKEPNGRLLSLASPTRRETYKFMLQKKSHHFRM